MADRVSTGLPSLDSVIDYLRIGDNVVWQVDQLEDYIYFARHFVKQAHQDNRKLVYLRFGQHPALVDNADTIYHLDPELGFEGFSSRVYQIATQEGPGVCYLFDSLSELVSTWATDLMVGNFFRITCPYLYELDTIAYFTILRGQNSYQTIARIRETTQLFIDVYQVQKHLYIHPLKVYNRYSPTMYLPHIQNDSQFDPITNSLEAARLFTVSSQIRPGDTGRKLDYWDKVFLQAEQAVQPNTINPEREAFLLERLARMLLGRDEKILTLARQYFTLQQLLTIRHRMIGSGFIGGKSVGMLLARAILEKDHSEPWAKYLEPHDSFYVGSDVYYTFLIENACWGLLQQVRKAPGNQQAANLLRENILQGRIPETISEQFGYLLDYYGQSPIIVRSSSLLEDSYNSAFAGKYQSIFCANQGSPSDRVQAFAEAVRQVYASTVDPDTLTYLAQRGLSGLDEQMGLLVQRVSGAHHSKYFFPDLAGVGLSCNPYTWNAQLSPEAGLLRLVLGMGTRAVDRVDEDYPLIASLDHPQLQPLSSLEDTHRYSQHMVDVIDLHNNQLISLPLAEVSPLRDEIRIWPLIASRLPRSYQGNPDSSWIIDYRQLYPIKGFWETMQHLLKALEQAYGHPVEIEFTINTNNNHQTFNLNLLQCRPFGLSNHPGTTIIQAPEMSDAQTLFATSGHTMGSSRSHPLDVLIYVVPEQYANLSMTDRYQVARLVGQLNRMFGQQGLTFILAGPGRWGTSTPSLGVPVSFAEINHASALAEVAFNSGGFSPELSFGTHFFHDLVEANIFYLALFPNEANVTFNQELWLALPNHLIDFIPAAHKYQAVIKVIYPSASGSIMWLITDSGGQIAKCWLASADNKE